MHTHTFFVQRSRAEGCGLKILKIPVESTRCLLHSLFPGYAERSALTIIRHLVHKSHPLLFACDVIFYWRGALPLSESEVACSLPLVYLSPLFFIFFPLFSFLMNINSISSMGKFLPFFQRILATPIASRKKIVARAKFVCMVTRCVFTP